MMVVLTVAMILCAGCANTSTSPDVEISPSNNNQTFSLNTTCTAKSTPIPAVAMFRANAQHTGEYDNGGIEPVKTEIWQFATGGAVSSSPAVSGRVVYVGSDDKNVYAIDAVTGKEKWRFITGGAVTSSPAVSGGVVYVGSDDKNFYAIDAATGKEKWRFTTEENVGSSPTVANGVVYVRSHCVYLNAIDAVTGKEKWRFTTVTCVEDSSPAVANGIVYVISYDKENLYAIDAATGKEKWRVTTGEIVGSSSLAVVNDVIYILIYKNLLAIDAVTGKEKWRFATGNYIASSLAVANGVVYVGGNIKNLYAIDAATGKEKWRFATGSYITSSLAVANGVVYVGSHDKNLYAIDAATGKEKWRFATGGAVTSSPAVSGGVVYVGSSDGNVYAIGQKNVPAVLKSEESLKNSQKSQPVENTIPYQVLSPVVGPLGFTTCCNENCKNRIVNEWEFCQHKSGKGDIGHITNGGICKANDTYAWDINYHLQNLWDYDAGKPVYAVASGKVVKTYGGCLNIDGSYGQVLLEHPGGWWSGYLHMKDIRVIEGQEVNDKTLLGYISNKGVSDGNNHLHFVVYKGGNREGGLESFNVEIIPRLTNPIE
jgi:outer membrane protein assembly factor BamB